MNGLGDVLAVLGKARGLTPDRIGRAGWDSPSRRPTRRNQATVTPTNIVWLAKSSVRPERSLLIHGNRFQVQSMRICAATGPRASAWRQLEARLNLLRVHASFLFEGKLAINSGNMCPRSTEFTTPPKDAARLITQWRMPMGDRGWRPRAPGVRGLRHPAHRRVVQWVDDYPSRRSRQRGTRPKAATRLTNSGHLTVLHSTSPTRTWRPKPTAFAAEFLMPKRIRPEAARRLRSAQLSIQTGMRRLHCGASWSGHIAWAWYRPRTAPSSGR